MRTHSDDAARLFDVAESILNTGDIRGNKRLFDAFDIPCDDAPPFIWNDAIKKDLESQLTSTMRLAEPCEVIHVQMAEEKKNGDTHRRRHPGHSPCLAAGEHAGGCRSAATVSLACTDFG